MLNRYVVKKNVLQIARMLFEVSTPQNTKLSGSCTKWGCHNFDTPLTLELREHASLGLSVGPSIPHLSTNYLSWVTRKLYSGSPTRSDTNRAVQPRTMARGLEFWI